MDLLFDFLEDIPVIWILLFAMIGLVVLAIEAAKAAREWWQGPPPTPRKYRVSIEDYENWPIRSYLLPAKEIGEILKQIERNKSS